MLTFDICHILTLIRRVHFSNIPTMLNILNGQLFTYEFIFVFKHK